MVFTIPFPLYRALIDGLLRIQRQKAVVEDEFSQGTKYFEE
jgi:hypothetical protein